MRDNATLKQLQSLPLEQKIIYSERVINEFLNKHDPYISFSGGKDSTVLLDLCKRMGLNLPAVFCDTGLEYPEVRRFAVEHSDIIIRPEMNFKQIIEKYGWPCVSKDVSQKIYEIRRTKSIDLLCTRLFGKLNKNGFRSSKLPNKWRKLILAPFNISHKCCAVMKKRPFYKYEKKTGKFPMTGEMASESRMRCTAWKNYGCNAFNTKRPKSKPLSIWTDEDIWDYAKKYDLKFASVYYQGYPRTGCALCLFGIMKDPARFKRLKETHPKMWEYGKSLGIEEVLEAIKDCG